MSYSRTLAEFLARPLPPPTPADRNIAPRISIAIPSFNQARYLEDTLASILQQRYPNLELIVMDGGSTDGSREILERLDPWIAHWRSERDGGQGDAVAMGLRQSTGDVLCWLNSDDLLMPGALEVVARAFRERPDAGLVFGNCLLIDERNAVRRLLFSHEHAFNPHSGRADNVFQGSTFWSRPAFERAGGIDGSLVIGMEYPLLAWMFRHEPCVFLDRFLACFRMYATQRSNTIRETLDREIEATVGPDQTPVLAGVSRRLHRYAALARNGHLPEKVVSGAKSLCGLPL